VKRCLICGWFNLFTERDTGRECHRCRLPMFDIEIKDVTP
jgi:hypothetical protein